MNAQTPVAPLTNDAVKTDGTTEQEVKAISADQVEQPQPDAREERTWSEEIELAGSQLVDQFKQWLAEGNVRRLILRTPDDSLLLEIPLVAGAVVGGVVTIFAPLLAVVGAIASVLAHVKVEVVRVDEPAPRSRRSDRL